MDVSNRVSRPTLLAAVLALMGGIAIGGGWFIPDARAVLFALGGVFFFAAASFFVLVSADPGLEPIYHGIHADLIANQLALMEAYELQDRMIYVPNPRNASDENEPPAWLFVPRYADFEIPKWRELESILVSSETGQDTGVSFRPSATTLFRRFESVLEGELGDSPEGIVTQLADGLVGLNVVRGVEWDVQQTENRISFYLRGTAFDLTEQFDYPLQSFCAVGLSVGLDCPVRAETVEATDDRYDYRVVCEWYCVETGLTGDAETASTSQPTDLSPVDR